MTAPNEPAPAALALPQITITKQANGTYAVAVADLTHGAMPEHLTFPTADAVEAVFHAWLKAGA